MKLSRDWATPLTMGAFVITSVTGVLMFFHLDRGLNKPAHEWLGWLMLFGVATHAAVNVQGFKRHLTSRIGQVLVGLGVALLALSFWQPASAPAGSPGKRAVHAMLAAPLDAVAPVLAQDAPGLRAHLAQRGLNVPAGQTTTLAQVAQANGRDPMQVLAIVLERKRQP